MNGKTLHSNLAFRSRSSYQNTTHATQYPQNYPIAPSLHIPSPLHSSIPFHPIDRHIHTKQDAIFLLLFQFLRDVGKWGVCIYIYSPN